MERFIHQQNLTLLRKRLEEAHTDAERDVLRRLLADEEAKDFLDSLKPQRSA